MEHFTCVEDVKDIGELIEEAIALKQCPTQYQIKHKTLGLIFLNPSLRTLMSTQKAAINLGVNLIVLNINEDSWKLEFENGVIMNGSSQEHIKDSVNVMSQYCDILGVRTFAGLLNKKEDYNEKVLQSFIEYSQVPVISLESATKHPLQSFTDLITIREFGLTRPKIALTWTPHPKKLPQAVPNSLLEWLQKTDAQVYATFPEGYELKESFLKGAEVTHNQNEALRDADIVYAKNWSSYNYYGKNPCVNDNWTITEEKMKLGNQAKFMHCLPIRRNVVATDKVIDSSRVYEQAKNRVFAAQIILKKLLCNG